MEKYRGDPKVHRKPERTRCVVRSFAAFRTQLKNAYLYFFTGYGRLDTTETLVELHCDGKLFICVAANSGIRSSRRHARFHRAELQAFSLPVEILKKVHNERCMGKHPSVCPTVVRSSV